jgi:hypothetical protein
MGTKRTTTKKSKIETEAPKTITRGFKGFDKDLKCRGMQFEPGKTFEVPGDPKMCERGLHFCEHPLDCFSYYPPARSRYFTVETDCVSPETGDDTKRVTSKLTIGAEVNIAGLVKAACEWVWGRAKVVKGGSTSSTWGAAQASGTRGAAQASGYQGAAQASGTRGAAQASGYQGAAQASGDQGAAQASGYQGAAQASGYQGAAQASGTRGAAQASGYQGAAQASGDQGAAQASGDHSVALAAGYEARAKGKIGCAICCVEREWPSGRILAVKASIVDGETVKADTWYILQGGEFVEAGE